MRSENSLFLGNKHRKAKLLQSCLTLCNPRGLYPSRLPCPWDSPGKTTGVGCHALLQGIFPPPGRGPVSPTAPALAGRFFTTGATWDAVYINSFPDSLPLKVITSIEHSSLCYTVGPCYLFILHIVLYVIVGIC